MTSKEIAKAIDNLSKEEVQELIKELFVLGYTAPEPVEVEKQDTITEVATQRTFSIKLLESGGKKLEVVKYWKNTGDTSLTLMQSKALIDSAPVVLKEGLNQQEANNIKEELEGLGASVAII